MATNNTRWLAPEVLDGRCTTPAPASPEISHGLVRVLVMPCEGAPMATNNPRWLAPEVLDGQRATLASVSHGMSHGVGLGVSLGLVYSLVRAPHD